MRRVQFLTSSVQKTDMSEKDEQRRIAIYIRLRRFLEYCKELHQAKRFDVMEHLRNQIMDTAQGNIFNSRCEERGIFRILKDFTLAMTSGQYVYDEQIKYWECLISDYDKNKYRNARGKITETAAQVEIRHNREAEAIYCILYNVGF